MADLLPPNATPLERAASEAIARIGDIPVPLAALWDPETCPIELLPWLAWSLGADWSADWSRATRRAAVADAIALHRVRGTVAAVKTVLARIDMLIELVEGWQSGGAPYSFEVIVPVGSGGPLGSTRTVAAIARDVDRVKPVRAHYTIVQQMVAQAAFGIVAGAAVTRFDRREGVIAPDTDPRWGTYLLTEDGEPIEDQAGALLVAA